MPGQRVHTAVGTLSGAAYAWYRSSTETEWNRILETLGGALGGGLGGRLPDILEPADSPNHRGPAHGFLAGGAALAAKLEGAHKYCCDQAETYRVKYVAHAAVNDPVALLYWLVEMFWRIAAGLLSGLQAGYLSHLALDALTPRSLPLLG
jgi:membrane-bound metal-dependent hydrolase YbcI (DUF457 family)